MGGIVKALEFFGGAPKTLIVDNAKSLVVTHGKDKIVSFNRCAIITVSAHLLADREPLKGKIG